MHPRTARERRAQIPPEVDLAAGLDRPNVWRRAMVESPGDGANGSGEEVSGHARSTLIHVDS